MRKPLCIDLFSGLGGWSEGALAAGYEVVGFDIERHEAAGKRYPAQLVLQDVLTLHGSQFRNASLILASPPCQNYSYLAMPWSRSENPENSKAAKALRKKWETEGPDNRLFDACFRIQREACEAATQAYGCARCGIYHPATTLNGCDFMSRYIPLIVENVRGAQPWVGRAKANFGSFYLWGDVAQVGRRIVAGVTEFGAGMNGVGIRVKCGGSAGDDWFAHHNRDSMLDGSRGGVKSNPDGTDHPQGSWFRIADSSQGDRGQKVPVYSDPRRNGGKGVHLTSPAENEEATKIGGDWFRDPVCHSKHGSRSNRRKQASAMIAKIPFALAYYIACAFRPAGDPVQAAVGLLRPRP